MPLPANNKFAKPGAAGAKTPPKKTPPKPKPKKFGTATDAQPKDPMLDPGEYRVRHIGAEELIHPVKKTLSWRVQFVVVTEEGDSESPNIALFMNTTAGIAEYQRYCMAMAGYESAAEYNEFDPEGDFFETVIGESNAFSEAGHTIERRLCDVVVTFGKPVLDRETGQPTGDHYRNYRWAVVPDEEQDEAAKVEAS
jgi:hypothetical protein